MDQLPLQQLAKFLESTRTSLFKALGTPGRFPSNSKGKPQFGKLQFNRPQFNIPQLNIPLLTKPQFKLAQKPNRKPNSAPNIENQIQSVIRNLTSSMSKIKNGLIGEDYSTVLKNFIPSGARLLKPQYPANSKEIQLTDLDGDSRDELVVSYKHLDEIRTIVLKKQNEHWYKAAETGITGYKRIKYRNAANIAGGNKKQLLMGLTSGEKLSTLNGYSLEDGNLKSLFTRDYQLLEVVDQPKSGKSIPKTHLAFWDEEEPDIHNINVMQWNGSQLEPLQDASSYYTRKVIPYYKRKIKRMPYSPVHWYNFANASEKAGAYGDAATAVDIGMKLDESAAFKERFTELRNRIDI